MSSVVVPQTETLLALATIVAAFGIATILFLVRGIVGLGRERLRTRSAVERGGVDDRLGLILDALPDPLELLDERGRTVASNEAFARLGPGTMKSVPDGETESGTRRISWTESGVEIGDISYRLRLGRDVTAQHEAMRAIAVARARAEAENDAKSRLLATVSHEFRTPLNGILGMTGLLLDTGLDAEQTTYVQAARSSAEAFLALVDDILDLSRIEAGRLDLVDEPFDLGALVQGVVELLAPRAQGKGTEIACFVGRDVPRTVRGDADRLRQVLFNLVGNAVKFTQTGGVGVAVHRDAGDLLHFSISDTGPGIPADRAAAIFEAFEQAAPASAGETGTGLGLAITRRLVDRMGGRIELDDTVGRGACFRFALALPAVASDTAPVHRCPARRVLILSGSPFAATYLARTLVEAEAVATVAETLDDAVLLMESGAFDVLVADHALPDGDVRVAAREARRHGIGRSLVLLSPFERRDFGLPHAAGFDGYLVKPVRAASLFEQLAARPAKPIPVLAKSEARAPVRGRSRRVLLAEDNEVNALLAVKALERLGARVEWARDGRDALNRLEASLAGGEPSFDVVLMDLRMPGLDGHEVTRRVRAIEAERDPIARLRIIALTASAAGQEQDAVRSSGFDGLLSKPFGFEALAAEIDGPDRLASAG